MQLIFFISVAYASWYHWNCGQTQRKAAIIMRTSALVPNVLPRRDEGSGMSCADRSLIAYWPPLRIRNRAIRFHCTLNLLSTHNRIRTLMDYLLCHHPTTNPMWHLGGMDWSCNNQSKLCLGWVLWVSSHPGNLWCIIPHKGILHNIM